MSTAIEILDEFELHQDFEVALAAGYDAAAFRRGILQIMDEFSLQDHLDRVSVGSPDRGRAELFRAGDRPWPSREVVLLIYPCRWNDDRLLRHEFGHEADRHNPAFGYDPSPEGRAFPKGRRANALNLAWDISLDSRLNPRGLTKEHRLADFLRMRVGGHPRFEDLWAHPPRTHAEVLNLALEFQRVCLDPSLL